MTSFFEHQRTNYKRNYVRNLIALASSDGNLDFEERLLIHTIGLRRGLKSWQINELFDETEPHDFFVPDSRGNRMNLLYDLMQIVYADGKVTQSEVSFVTNIISTLGLDPEVVQELLSMFQSNSPGISEWNDFIEDFILEKDPKFKTIL